MLACAVVAAGLGGCEPAPAERPSAIITLEALPVIGREVGEGPDVFGRVGDVETDGSGNVYVLDRHAGAVRVFDEQGAFVRSIGRRGRGPGELENPVAIGWGPEGNLWIVDPGNGRYSVFEPLGELLATHPRTTDGIAGGWPVTFTADGRLFDVSPEFGLEGLYLAPMEHQISTEQVRRIGQVELPALGRWGEAGVVLERPGQMLLIEVPFSPMLMWQIDSQGNLWYANTAEYEVRRRSLDDGTELLFAGSSEPPAVTEAERKAALERDEMLERSMIPTTKPPIEGFFPGEDGGLWVLRPTSGAMSGGGSTADVFDAGAVLIASVDVDLEMEPRPKLRHGVVVGVTRDALGVERIARYRIAR
jgi:hypothetical protein